MTELSEAQPEGVRRETREGRADTKMSIFFLFHFTWLLITFGQGIFSEAVFDSEFCLEASSYQPKMLPLGH